MPRTSLPDGRNKRISEWHLEFAFTLGTSLTTEGDIVLNAGTFQTSLPLPGNLDCNLAISTVSRLSEISCSIGGERGREEEFTTCQSWKLFQVCSSMIKIEKIKGIQLSIRAKFMDEYNIFESFIAGIILNDI